MIGIPREQYLTESTLPTVRELSLQNGIFRIADGSRFVLRGALEESSAAALASERIRQYWNCEGAKLYAVSSIPHTVLIDGEGTIIARGLHGEGLLEKLAEVLK